MRLLDTKTLEFKEFYDYQIPEYAILSHRWGPVEEEVTYNDYIAGCKTNTPGYQKIMDFCGLANRKGIAYCWIDTCCIDKSSSAELSEAINSMFAWYERAQFSRGWTLQELIAPRNVIFRSKDWTWLGSRTGLSTEIAAITGIDQALLDGQESLGWYSTAQIMSWAAHRTTSRLEDEAYCLLGLFRVTMPLLYGEGGDAFRRLQEVIMTRMEDNSLFLWGSEASEYLDQIGHASVLASSPHEFKGCNDIGLGFASQRILFEVTSEGIMVSLHRSYDEAGVTRLLKMADEYRCAVGQNYPHPIRLTVPLGCYRRSALACDQDPLRRYVARSYFLQLILESGKWRRIGITSRYSEMYWSYVLQHQVTRFFAYTNDYVRIYLHHDRSGRRNVSLPGHRTGPDEIQYIDLQDSSLGSSVYDLQASPLDMMRM